ncbi:MAG: nitroreductase family protein [Salinivirgaceae bacterium]|nr:nitroreductase family protein [Salinivirgaceae bacterium]
MKKILLSIASVAAVAVTNAQDINLPAPDFSQSSTSTIEALKTRHSVRSFTNKELTNQQLSNLCWAACGQSRDAQHITAPTAMNKQEIRLFVFTKNGAFEYVAKDNKLVKKADGDHRSLIAGGKQFKQDFVMDCPVSLLMVIDFEKFGSQDNHAQMMGCVDAGIVSENINLYCQSVGLATVPRATHDTEGLKALLGLGDKQLPILNNPVGFEKK